MEFENYYSHMTDATYECSFFIVRNAFEHSSSPAFADMDSAIEYAIKNNYPSSILKEVLLYKGKDGKLYKDEKFLYMIPNLYEDSINYQVIGRDTGDIEPEVICYCVGNVKDYDEFDESIRKNDNFNFKDKTNLGLYSAKISLTNDKKSINVDYQLLHEINLNKSKK